MQRYLQPLAPLLSSPSDNPNPDWVIFLFSWALRRAAAETFSSLNSCLSARSCAFLQSLGSSIGQNCPKHSTVHKTVNDGDLTLRRYHQHARARTGYLGQYPVRAGSDPYMRMYPVPGKCARSWRWSRSFISFFPFPFFFSFLFPFSMSP